jgi:hypothetical protein
VAAPNQRHHPDRRRPRRVLQAAAASRARLALGLRPVHHREDQIRAHAQLCWLALLLLRVVENAADDTWRNTRNELDRMHLVTLATADGQVAQRSALTAGHKAILAALELPEPPRFFDFAVPTD